jgi:hypothetical protein
MNNHLRVLRVVTLVLASLTSAIFVHAFSLLQANRLQFVHKLNLAILPLPTVFYHRYAWAGYLLPLAAAALLGLKVPAEGDRIAWFEVLVRTVGFAALLWTLAAILAWQLPLYYPVERIE